MLSYNEYIHENVLGAAMALNHIKKARKIKKERKKLQKELKVANSESKKRMLSNKIETLKTKENFHKQRAYG